MAKKGVVLYYDLIEQLDGFTDEDFGKITRAIIIYDRDGTIPIFDNPMLTMAFKMLKPNLDSNKEKYQLKCEKNRANIQARWQQKSNTNEYERMRTNTNDTKHTDNDNVTDNDNDIDLLSKKESNKKESEYQDNACVRESYDTIFEDFGVSKLLKEQFIEFIRHCQINKRVVTNDKLKNLIIRLDMHYQDDVPKIQSLKNAIMGGYFDIAEK